MAEEGFSFFSQHRTARGSWCEVSSSLTPAEARKRGSVDSEDFVPSQGWEEPQWPDLVDLARTKPGSKQVQGWIAAASVEQRQTIQQTLAPHFLQLSQDPCGNYVCQRLLQHCSAAERLQLLESLREALAGLALHPIATHVVQTLVSLISLPNEEELIATWLQVHFLRLARHEYGTHVVQKLLLTCRKPVLELVLLHFPLLATDKFGIGAVKRAISDAVGTEQEALWQAIAPLALELAQDPYGNYAIQHILDVWPGTACTLYTTRLQGCITQLSLQKCSSNVVEKCVEKADPETLSLILTEVSGRLALLSSNSFGIYVLRSLLRAASEEARATLKNQLRTVLVQVPSGSLRTRTEALLQE